MISREMANNQPVEELVFEEFPGEGIRGVANGVEVIIGSRALLLRFEVDVLKPVDEGLTKSYLAINKQYYGVFTFSNRYREGIEHTLQNLSQSYQITLLSGDSDAEAPKLKAMLGTESNLLFRQSPADKMAALEYLQQHGSKVLMLGDGLNDAGALKQSEVGIAVADSVNQFFPASDGMLHARNINLLPAFLQFSKDNIRVIKACLFISLSYNITGVSIAVAGLLTPLIAAILMPLSSVSVVLAVTLATNYFARKRGITTKN
jgi:Cu+-exporting ATPase